MTLAHRTGRPGCWARFPLDRLGERSTLCIPQRLWLKTYSDVGMWNGTWRASSPLVLEPGQKKQVIYSFHAFEQVESTSTRRAWFRPIERRRETLSEWLRNSGADASGIFRHLLLAEDPRAAIPLRVLGWIRLFNANGLQLIALSAWIGLLLGLALRLSGVSSRAAIPIRGGLSGVVWLWSWILAGARGAMLRPLLLLSIRALGRRAGLRWNRRMLFLWSAGFDFGLGTVFCLLRHDSIGNELLDPGRIFYLLAVGSALLAWSRESRGAGNSGLGRFFSTAFATWVVTATYLLAQERFTSLLSPFIACLTLPWLAGVIYPTLILRSLVPENLARAISEMGLDPVKLLRATHLVLEWLARLAFRAHSIWWVSSEALILSIALASLVWLLPIRMRARVAGCVSIVLVSCAFIRHPLRPTRSVEQLDVGQGDAALVVDRTGDVTSAGLIDAGSAHALNDLQWLELLAGRGLARVNWMAATHLDEDHAGGFLTLSEVAEVGCATTSAPELESDRGIRWARALDPTGFRSPRSSRTASLIPRSIPPFTVPDREPRMKI